MTSKVGEFVTSNFVSVPVVNILFQGKMNDGLDVSVYKILFLTDVVKSNETYAMTNAFGWPHTSAVGCRNQTSGMLCVNSERSFWERMVSKIYTSIIYRDFEFKRVSASTNTYC